MSFTLIDADRNQPISGFDPMREGATLDLTTLPTKNLNLRANTAPDTVGSVVFGLNDNPRARVENAAPYALFSDSAGNYRAWTPPPGNYTITATPYPRTDGRGTAGMPLTLSFRVVEETAAPERQRYLYVIPSQKILVYDMDAGYRLVKSIDIPGMERPWGATAHAGTNRLYISLTYRDSAGVRSGRLLAYDLIKDRVLWTRTYSPDVDSLEVTPDGKTIYMASGENRRSDYWYVIDAESGDLITKISVYPGTHNTVVGLDGKQVYLSSVKYYYLTVADTGTNQVIRRIGPFGGPVRPFTVNGAQTLAFVNIYGFSGFEIGDVRTGEKLHSVEVQGFPWEQVDGLGVQSHGISLSPDEREVWMVDAYNKYLHIFDATGLPTKAPIQVAGIALSAPPKWINFSRDGRFVHVSTGDIVDTKTRRIVATTEASKIRLQIDFLDGRPVQAYSRYGLGYGAAEPSPAPTGQRVYGFTLINADTNQPIGPLRDGDTLSFARLGTRNLNIRADTDPAVVGSVRFALDGNDRFRVENGAPYALASDSAGDYHPWTPGLGGHSVSATPYTRSSERGTAGTPLTVSFTVTD